MESVSYKRLILLDYIAGAVGWRPLPAIAFIGVPKALEAFGTGLKPIVFFVKGGLCMKKWKDRVTSQKGFSVIEVLCTVVITVAAIAVFMVIANSYAAKAAKGTDSLMMKSAEKIAAVNLNANDTIFSEPGEAVTPPYTGYFDDISKGLQPIFCCGVQ